MEKYKFLEHTADIKFQAFGKNMEEVFKNSALATTDTMCDEHIEKILTENIKIEASDKESLLYDFLDQIIFLFDSENFLVSDIKDLEIKENQDFQLTATLIGDSSEKYEIKEHIKSVTYHEMFIREEDDRWTAQVVLDV